MQNDIIPIKDTFPQHLFLLPIKGKPIFPEVIMPLTIPEIKMKEVIETSLKLDSFLGLVLVKDEDRLEEQVDNNIYQVGVLAKILKRMHLPDGSINILINSLVRFKIENISNSKFLSAQVSYPEVSDGAEPMVIKAMTRSVFQMGKELANSSPAFTEEMKLTILNVEEPGKISDFISSILNLTNIEYQSIIESFDLRSRLEKVLFFLKREIELTNLQNKINFQIGEKIEKQQRNFFLKEQLKAVQSELGLKEDKDLKKFYQLLETLKKNKVEEEVIEELEKEILRFENADKNTSDYNVIRNYLDIISSLPWSKKPKKKINIEKAIKILDREHYKLDEVKERIIEMLSVLQLNPERKGTILLLVGPPGVGKTSIAASIAKACDKKFFRFSVGGLRDEAEIKGHRRTYVGAMPGKIINALKFTKQRDIVILLDEIDKLSSSYQGDPASALLEVLDPEQNKNFRDHYLDIPFDISDVFFIATANTLDTIPRVLLDRMEIIELSGYVLEEKVKIFEKYLWKKVIRRNGLEKYKLKLNQKAIKHLINSYSRESGVRGLEKQVDKLTRKISFKIVQNKEVENPIKDTDLRDYLGIPKFSEDQMITPTKAGMALGLAWTQTGGATLMIEAIFLKDAKEIFLTGMAGKTMSESSLIALHYIKNLLNQEKYFKGKAVHLHIPDGATPKDGPSAGITMATAILSLALKKKIPSGFGMTGELTLTGEVFPIGGLREKIVAAKRAKVKKIIFPKENLKNLEEIPDYIKQGLDFFPVSKYTEVCQLLNLRLKN